MTHFRGYGRNQEKNRLFFGGNEKKKICFRHFLTFKGCPNSNEENGQEQEIHRETPLVTVAEFIQDFRATINLEEESEYVKSNIKIYLRQVK